MYTILPLHIVKLNHLYPVYVYESDCQKLENRQILNHNSGPRVTLRQEEITGSECILHYEIRRDGE